MLLVRGDGVCHLPVPHMSVQPTCKGSNCNVTCVAMSIPFQCSETFDVDALCRRVICEREEITTCTCGQSGIDCIVSNSQLPNGLPLFPRLELFGSFTMNKDDYQELESYLPVIKHYPMKTLHLHYFQMDSLANKTFPGFLRDLETLHLYNCRIRSKAKFDYPCLPKLQTLALITAALESFDLWQFPCSSLKHLMLDNNQITELSGSCDAPSASSLESLQLTHWMESYKQKPLDLRGLVSLQYLDIERISAQELADVMLPQNNSLLGMKLSGSQIQSFTYDDLYDAIDLSISVHAGSGPLSHLFRNFTVSDSITCATRYVPMSYMRGDNVLECDCEALGMNNLPFCPDVRRIACPTGGQTFRPSQVCDGHMDCQDGHDERHCNLSGIVVGEPPCFSRMPICAAEHLGYLELLTQHGIMVSREFRTRRCGLRAPIRAIMTGTYTFEGIYGTFPST